MIQQPDSSRYTEPAKHILQRRAIPALAAVTMTSASIVSAEVHGTRVAGTDNPATLDDFFHIGSCAKSLLAIIAGKLVEGGRLDWDARLLDVLPELRAAAREEYASVTLTDLLLCRAGIAAYTSGQEELPALNPLKPDVRMDFARDLLSRGPVAEQQPDGSFPHVYSNASYTIASVILERASGFDWETLVHQALVDGYGLDVRFGWPNREEPETQPWGHGVHDGALRPCPPGDPYALSPLLAPAGDLSMRPLDYARYVQHHLRGLRGVDGYVTAATIRHIHHAQRGFSLGTGNGRYYGKAVSQMDGSAGTFYCHSIIVPADDFAYVVMTNAGGPEAMAGVYQLSARIMKERFGWWWKFWM